MIFHVSKLVGLQMTVKVYAQIFIQIKSAPTRHTVILFYQVASRKLKTMCAIM